MRFLPIEVSNYVKRFTDPKGAMIEDIKRELKKDKGSRLSINLTHYRTFKADMQQDNLRQAIDFAEDPERPDRSHLLAIYKEVMRDPHLLSQIRTNILKVLGSPFAVFKAGTDEIDEEATKLLQKPWFNRFRYIFHETPYYGHTLVEFQQMFKPVRDNGLELEFKKVKVFPRHHVRPETGEIILDYTMEKGLKYREEPFNEWLLEIGDSHDIGLLNIAAREVIWKNYSRSDWSRFGEKFGLPIIAVKTASNKKEELDKLEKMASEFGNNLYMILDDEDEFEIKEPSKANGYQVFKDKADFCDAQNSKLISGQTGTSDEKAFVGSAEVHENILNEYMEEAMRNETYYNNEELIPFLIRHGYPLEGLEFRYLAFMNDEVEADDSETDDPPKDPKKTKKPSANFTEPLSIKVGKGLTGTLSQRVAGLYNVDCCNSHHIPLDPKTLIAYCDDPVAVVDLDRAVNKAVKRVYDGKLKAGGVDEELFWNWAADLWRGTLQGYGVNFSKLQYGSPSHQLLNQLRHNVHVFAAFKNHHHTNELVKALVDDEGQIRSFGEFKKAAKGINEKYNKNWLKTEHTQAVLSGRNANKWLKIQERKSTFPNVEYVVVPDERLSQICKDLAGAIWSVDDPILKKLGPGNHWRCRSFLRSTKKAIDKKTTGEEIQPAFDNNPGITGDAFGKGHPYYEVQDQHQDKATNLFGLSGQMPISPEQLAANTKLLDRLDKKQYSEINTFAQQGGWFAVHKLAHKSDLKKNKQMATAMAKNGYAVEILEHVEDGTPNPEFRVNGILSDLKSPKTPYGLDTRLRSALKQGLNNVVYEVAATTQLDELTKGLRRGFHNRRGIEWVDVVYDKKVVRIDREMFLNGEILKELESVLK
ncbi:phage portal protein family protein [Reichenbachiella sp.]|uniref:phage portal protein family protein n=1 Tax=Reichenbachiella sp. TaxID=2184521 RepID=UPI003B5CFBF7